MINFLLESVVTACVSYAILLAIFDSHLFSSYRGAVHKLKGYAEAKHKPVLYAITYLLSCYMCTSYWVCWIAATLVFFMSRNCCSVLNLDFLVIFLMGLTAKAILDLMNSFMPSAYNEEEDFHFFPWNKEK